MAPRFGGTTQIACTDRSRTLQQGAPQLPSLTDGCFLCLQTALNFTGRLAQLCKKHSKVGPGTRALDVGCAVGGATFELARYYDTAVGIDFSHAFVAAAQVRG